LIDGVRQYVLNSRLMRNPSPPNLQRELRPDGSNLPWVVAELQQRTPERHQAWVEHLRSALPDLRNVTTVERDEDRHRYLMLEYDEGLRVPSWMASDGTLRLLALTVPAYLPEFNGILLIEEPENGIHPRAVETMFQSLSSVYGAQVLLATHSPVILSVTDIRDVLCFARDPSGATDIVSGDQHPSLRNWRGETNLGTLFAAGVLG
jgi:predicted ATPase